MYRAVWIKETGELYQVQLRAPDEGPSRPASPRRRSLNSRLLSESHGLDTRPGESELIAFPTNARDTMTPPDTTSHALPLPAPRRPAPRTKPTAEARSLAAERLLARKRRISLIRRRVVAIAIAIFLAITAVILVRLASGHDPALVAAAARTSTSTATASSGSASTGSSSSSSSSGSSSSSSQGSTSSVSTSSS